MPQTILVLLFCAVAAAHAQPVEVMSVRFSNVRPATGAPGNWLEAAVSVNARPESKGPAPMVSRVRVSVLLGFELPAAPGGERRLEHYRAEAECVALEPGRSDIRFYLPPEIVRRDQLHGDPKYWGVELTVGGAAVPAGRGAYVAALATAEQRQNFQARGGAAAAANDGLLQPQYLTPFVHDYPRATPTFVRRESR